MLTDVYGALNKPLASAVAALPVNIGAVAFVPSSSPMQPQTATQGNRQGAPADFNPFSITPPAPVGVNQPSLLGGALPQPPIAAPPAPPPLYDPAAVAARTPRIATGPAAPPGRTPTAAEIVRDGSLPQNADGALIGPDGTVWQSPPMAALPQPAIMAPPPPPPPAPSPEETEDSRG